MTEHRQATTIWRNVISLGLLVYWIVLFVSTHIPIDPEFGVPGNDKVLHFVGYGILGGLLMLTCLARRPGSPTGFVAAASVGLWLGVWGVIAVYGAVDELTQPWAGRFCDFNDWLADIGGGAIGLALAWVVWWSVRSRWRTESEV